MRWYKISYIEFKNINKRYKGNKEDTLSNFSLNIEKGEFIVIVGPSGSGKSTLLELICGFEEITEGAIVIDDKVINNMEPKERDVAMVFQNYAIYPHLSAYENIAFGMKIRKVKKKEIDEKVRWAAKILQLEEYLNKKPHELSGGQRQRIAIGRAMVREPKLFLMDEPLSNLDAKLRYSTANEITNLHKKINATTIYVTHDQTEALTMSDKIVILNEGKVQQVGTPIEVYQKPNNTFVAGFIGKPQINLLQVELKNNKLLIEDKIAIEFESEILSLIEDKKYILGIRSEQILKCHSNERCNNNNMIATIDKVEYLGSEIVLYLTCKGINFTLKTNVIDNYNVGEKISISLNLEKALIFDIETKELIGRQ